jgi:hypothetical protein
MSAFSRSMPWRLSSIVWRMLSRRRVEIHVGVGHHAGELENHFDASE